MKKTKENNQEKEILYIILDYSNDEVKAASKDKTKVFERIGNDFLSGYSIDGYRLIEINLNEVEE